MNNQHSRGGSQGRDLSGFWRPIANPPAGTSQPNAPRPNSLNYRGDLTNPRNLSADIPESENCGTWWTNLPPNCTYEMLFDSMRNVGAVSHAVINPPLGEHGTSAAKVEFFDRASVDRLLEQANSGHLRGHMRVGGRIPKITLNRIRVSAHSNAVPSEHGNNGRGSRVLQVIGNSRIVRRDILEALLARPNSRVIYGLERVRTFAHTDEISCVEFRFASYAVQAARARNVFNEEQYKRDMPDKERILWKDVICLFGPDPCE
ncbi:hypothetical protein F5Y08DRAFT_354267 [Xylaria arbuscula]|nr:hypothetical protein F5Y08DRAFT_354267 [Xylaria arbuscula]